MISSKFAWVTTIALMLFSLGTSPTHAQSGLRGVFVVTCRQPVWVFTGTIGGPARTERTKPRKLVAGETLPRGCTIATGKSGQVRCMVAGHTVVDVEAQTVVGVPTVPGAGAQSEPNKVQPERVMVYKGGVRTFTDPRYLSPSSELVLVSPGSRQATRRGYLTVRTAASSGTWSQGL